MIGSKEKKFQKKEASPPPKEKNHSFNHLPNYICYKSSLLREKVILSYIIGLISVVFVIHFVSSRIEISRLYEKLRVKEYILAPGIRDFTVATPQSVPESYVNDAATDFISTLGNINSSIVVEQYDSLKRFMSPELKIKFSSDSKGWINQVKTEDLAQILRIKKKEIATNGDALYSITAFVKADFYANSQSLGSEDQVVEMVLKLIPPERSKRWYLEIISLSWSKLDTFNTIKSIAENQ